MSETITLGTELEGFVSDIFAYRERLEQLKESPQGQTDDPDENLNDRLTLTEDFAAKIAERVQRSRSLIDDLLGEETFRGNLIRRALDYVKMTEGIDPFLDQLITYSQELKDYRSHQEFIERYQAIENLLLSLVSLFDGIGRLILIVMKNPLSPKMIKNVAFFVKDMRHFRHDHERLSEGVFSCVQRQALIEKLALELAKKADACQRELEVLNQRLG